MKAAATVVAAILDAAFAWGAYWALLGFIDLKWHPWAVGLILFFVLRAAFTFLMGVSAGQYLSGLRAGVAGIPGRLSGLGRVGAELILLWALPNEFALLCQKRLTWAERLAQAPLELTSSAKVVVSLLFALPLAVLLLLWAPAIALNPQWPTMMPESRVMTSPPVSAEESAAPLLWHSAYFAFDGPMAKNALIVPSFKIIRESLGPSSAVKVFPEAIIMQPNLVARLSVQGSYYWANFIPALASKDKDAKAAFFTAAFQNMHHPRLFKAWHWAAFAQAQSALTKILPYPVPAQGQILTLGDTTFLRLHQDLRPLAIADRQAADVLLPLSEENPTILEVTYQSIESSAILAWPAQFWPSSTKWNFAAQTNVEIPAEAFPAPEQFTVWQIFDFYMAPLAATQTDLLENFIFHYFYDLGGRPLPDFAQEQVRLALAQLATTAELLGQNTATAKFSPTYFKSLRDLAVSMFRPTLNAAPTSEGQNRRLASATEENPRSLTPPQKKKKLQDANHENGREKTNNKKKGKGESAISARPNDEGVKHLGRSKPGQGKAPKDRPKPKSKTQGARP